MSNCFERNLSAPGLAQLRQEALVVVNLNRLFIDLNTRAKPRLDCAHLLHGIANLRLQVGLSQLGLR
jgi:hypothetical protein